MYLSGESEFMDKDALLASLKQIELHTKKCFAILEGESTARSSPKKRSAQAKESRIQSPDFRKPIRAFVKKYAKGMGGPAKFVLLLSHFAKGDMTREIACSDVEKQWNKMTSATLLGMEYHHSYPRRAVDNDWVDSKKKGLYFLRPDWLGIFNTGNG